MKLIPMTHSRLITRLADSSLLPHNYVAQRRVRLLGSIDSRDAERSVAPVSRNTLELGRVRRTPVQQNSDYALVNDYRNLLFRFRYKERLMRKLC
jgi:hypothetical protein